MGCILRTGCYNTRMENTLTNRLVLFSVHATLWDVHDPAPVGGAVFVVAAWDEFDAMHLVREFLGPRSKGAYLGDPDAIGLAAGSGMRPDEIERGIVVSSQI